METVINDDLADSTEKAKIALEWELSTSDQATEGRPVSDIDTLEEEGLGFTIEQEPDPDEHLLAPELDHLNKLDPLEDNQMEGVGTLA